MISPIWTAILIGLHRNAAASAQRRGAEMASGGEAG
jgi:hypothetical protein